MSLDFDNPKNHEDRKFETAKISINTNQRKFNNHLQNLHTKSNYVWPPMTHTADVYRANAQMADEHRGQYSCRSDRGNTKLLSKDYALKGRSLYW